MEKKRRRSDEVCEASTSDTVSKKNKMASKISLTVGIPNPESICFMSSVIQVLANVKSYRDVILAIPTESSFDSDKILALQLMLTALLNQVGEDEISECMSNFCKVWQKNINHEGDCAEFLMEILSSLEDYLKNTALEESFERLVYCTGEAGGKESFIYLNPGGQDTKLEQEIHDTFKKLASNLIFSINRVADTGEREIRKMQFTTDLNSKVLNKLSASTMHKFSSFYKLTAVIVHKFKLNKPHYVVFVKSGSSWILHDDEMITKTSQKAVLETCGNSGGVEDQPLATMLIYTSLENTSDYCIPPHLTERYYKLFLHPKREVMLTVSVITGDFFSSSHRLAEESNVEVSHFEIFEEDMEKEVRQYLAPLFAFSLPSFQLRTTCSGYGGEMKVESRQISLSDTFSSLASGSRSLRLLHFGGLELSDVEPREQLTSICIKTFRNSSFFSDFYFSRMSGETVASWAIDSGIRKYTPFLVNGETVLKLQEHALLSALSQDGCIAVLVYDLSGNLEEYLTSLFNTVRIQLISEKGECRIEVNCDASSEQVYVEVGRLLNHASSKIQIRTVDCAGVPGPPIPSTEDLKPLLENLHAYRQPRILRVRLLEMELVEYEKLSDVTVTLCRLDLNKPRQINLKINLSSNPPLQCLLEKIDPVEIPASDEVKWEFCYLNAGKVTSILDLSTAVKSHLDEVLGLIEVPISGRVFSFFTYQETPMNRVGNPGIVAVSLCSNDIEKSLEEVIEGEILDISEFQFSMMKNSSFDVSTFLQECCLAEGPRPAIFKTCIGVKLGDM